MKKIFPIHNCDRRRCAGRDFGNIRTSNGGSVAYCVHDFTGNEGNACECGSRSAIAYCRWRHSQCRIFIVHRPQEPDQGCTIEHDTLVNDRTTSIFLVLDGAGTLVTGGKLAKPTPLSSNDPDLKLVGSGSRGKGIQNGQSRRISKGDVVIIPAGVPHGFSAIEKSITYEVVRIDSAKTLPLK